MSEEIPYHPRLAERLHRLIARDPTPGDNALPAWLIQQGTEAEKGTIIAGLTSVYQNFLMKHPNWRELIGLTTAQAEQLCSLMWAKDTKVARDILRCPSSKSAKLHFQVETPILASQYQKRSAEILSVIQIAQSWISEATDELSRKNPFKVNAWKIVPANDSIHIHFLSRAEAEKRWPGIKGDRSPDARAITIFDIATGEGTRMDVVLFSDQILQGNPDDNVLRARIAVSLAHEIGGNVTRILSGRMISREQGEVEAFLFGKQFADILSRRSFSNKFQAALRAEGKRQEEAMKTWQR